MCRAIDPPLCRYEYDREPFGVRKKEFYPLDKADKVIHDLIPKLSHESDGLIFQGKADSSIRAEDVATASGRVPGLGGGQDRWISGCLPGPALRTALPKEAPVLPQAGAEDPYVPGTFDDLLKWKFSHLNSVDLLLKVGPKARETA